MPIRQSRHLLALASRLRAIHVPEGDDLHWKHSTEFCSLHEAETTVIPLGIRDGYPETIDFPALQERLIHGWIGEELDGVVKDPRRSPLFGLTVRDITIMGKTRWVSMSHQSSERMVNRMMPG